MRMLWSGQVLGNSLPLLGVVKIVLLFCTNALFLSLRCIIIIGINERSKETTDKSERQTPYHNNLFS